MENLIKFSEITDDVEIKAEKHVGIEKLIALSEYVVRSCTKTDENNMEVVDKQLLYILKKVAFVGEMTNLDIEDDYLKVFNLIEYTDAFDELLFGDDWFVYADLIDIRVEEIERKNSLEAIISGAVNKFADELGDSLKTLSDVLEKVDTDNLVKIAVPIIEKLLGELSHEK